MVPLIGCVAQMVMGPTEFWDSQMARGKLSANGLLGKFMVMSTDAKESRKIFESCSDKLPLYLHPNSEHLFGSKNISFINGAYHKELRRRLLPMFTPKALGVYLDMQAKAIREHIQQWEAQSKQNGAKGLEMKPVIFELNTLTSLAVFLGTYLTDEQRAKFQIEYAHLTDGYLAFPINLPGFALHRGVKARRWVIKMLEEVTALSKARMRTGAEPSCLLDFWMQNTVKEEDEALKQAQPMPPHSSNHDVACVTLDFLFAAQDATTAALTWAVHLMCEHPDVVTKVKDEYIRVRGVGANAKPFTADLLDEMQYTNQVVREMLRHRPPVPLVPHRAAEEFQIRDNYTIPKGSVVIPCILSSNKQGFTNPDSFDPDRYSPERNEEALYGKNVLTFGAGPHSCLGYRYAQNHMACFVATLAAETQFSRMKTPKMNDIMYAPTVYPADSCMLTSFRVVEAH